MNLYVYALYTCIHVYELSGVACSQILFSWCSFMQALLFGECISVMWAMLWADQGCMGVYYWVYLSVIFVMPFYTGHVALWMYIQKCEVSNALGGPRPYASMCSAPSFASHSIFIQCCNWSCPFQCHHRCYMRFTQDTLIHKLLSPRVFLA